LLRLDPDVVYEAVTRAALELAFGDEAEQASPL
jgi:hypothetical protein